MPLVYGVVSIQASIWLVVTLMLLLIGRDAAVAGALSGLAVLGPGAAFAWIALRETDGRRLVAYGGAKLLLTITCLVIVLALMEPDPAGYFAGFISQYLAHALGSWWWPRQGVRFGGSAGNR